MNKWIGMGRLTKAPEIRYTQSENSQAMARFTLAVDRRKANADGQKEADFLNCVAFGRTAEFCEKYLQQGMKVCAEAHVQTGKYQNKEGHTVYTTDFVIDSVEFAESKKSDAPQAHQNGQNGGYNRQPNSYQQRPQNGGYGAQRDFKRESQQRPNEGFADEFMSIPDGVDSDALPFN